VTPLSSSVCENSYACGRFLRPFAPSTARPPRDRLHPNRVFSNTPLFTVLFSKYRIIFSVPGFPVFLTTRDVFPVPPVSPDRFLRVWMPGNKRPRLSNMAISAFRGIALRLFSKTFKGRSVFSRVSSPNSTTLRGRFPTIPQLIVIHPPQKPRILPFPPFDFFILPLAENAIRLLLSIHACNPVLCVEFV